MPHAGLMDENTLGPVEGPLQRARLHIRGGRRRLRQGKTSAGIVTLYDALLAAMQGYAASPGRRAGFIVGDVDNIDESYFLMTGHPPRSTPLSSFDFKAF